MAAMRAGKVVQPSGPSGGRLVDAPGPEPGPGDVLVDVHAVGVSFPDLLLSQGRYQVRPEPPFTLGVDLAGTVISAPEGIAGVEPGARVAGVLPYGAAAERVAVPASAVFPLPDRTSYDEGASLPMNYLTALFALRERGRVTEGETVLLDGFKDTVAELTGGRGVDVVLDVVGGEVFTNSLRCLAEQ